MRELHLFAGAGGGILGGVLLGHRCVCAVEIEPYRRACLLQRQRDGVLPWFPVWDDIRTFDGMPWRQKVDVVCGGFPCQDISCANTKKGKAGIDGERSGLWAEMFRVVCEVQPKFVFVENSPALVIRGLGRVLGDLAKVGYDANWGVFSASDAGAPHIRERIWILAYTPGVDSKTRVRPRGIEVTFERDVGEKVWGYYRQMPQNVAGADPVLPTWQTKFSAPALVRVDDGVPYVMDRVAALGDSQVPAVVKLAWEALMP